MGSSITSERKGTTRPWRDKKRNLKNYDRGKQLAAQISRIAGIGKIQIQMNGTTVKPNEESGTTQTTTTTPVNNNNNRVKWVHNLSKTPPD